MINFNTRVLARSVSQNGGFFESDGEVTDVIAMHGVTLYEVTFASGNKDFFEEDALIDTSELDAWYDSVAAARAEYDEAGFQMQEFQHTMDGLPRV